MLTFPVPREHAGQRLDRFVRSRIPRLSRTRAQHIVRACARKADGTPRRASERVREGETVLIVRPSFREPDAPRHFEVVYEDDAVLALDKPAGLPMHPTATYHRNTLTWLLRQRYGDAAPRIAHRLDRETSGLVVCGHTLSAERALKQSFERREVQKRYLAIVRGEMPEDHGWIEYPLAPSSAHGASQTLHVLMEVSEQGQPARTQYEVWDRRPGRTLVALRPETGRQHQLRVHLSEMGYPILGDKLYGPAGAEAFLDYIETGMTPELARRAGHERQALHAYELSLDHPRTGEPMRLQRDLPPDLRELWEAES